MPIFTRGRLLAVVVLIGCAVFVSIKLGVSAQRRSPRPPVLFKQDTAPNLVAAATAGLQVVNTSGTSVVDGITASVAGSGDVGNFSPCGASTGPYFMSTGGAAGSYTFNFSAPVGSVEIDAVFAGGGTPGQVHFVKNGSAYAISDANLAGTVGGCAPGVLAVASNGDLSNAGNLVLNPNNRVIIPGPITSLTVSSPGTAGVIFGVFITPSTYFQVANTSGVSTVNGVTTTVTSGGTAGIFAPCGAAVGPYFLQNSGDFYNYSFSPAVDGVNVPVVYSGGGTAGTTHFAVNGSGVSLTNGNIVGPAPSGCSTGLLAVVSGGDLTNTGNLAANPNATVMLPNSGTVSSLNVSSLGTATTVSGLFITKGTNAAFSFTHSSNQLLSAPVIGPAVPINSLLAISSLNPNLTLTWTVAVNPLHGQLVLGGIQTSVGGVTSPTGFTYQRLPGYSGPDGFTIIASDGINSAATTVMVLTPTAAGVSVSGRVLTPEGRGLSGAIVVLTDVNGSARSIRSSTFGYFTFDNVHSGEAYVVTVSSRLYRFTPQLLTVNDNLTGINLVADGSP